MFSNESKDDEWKERTMKTGNTQEKKMTLVLGGTGKTGRRVAQRLEARGMPTRVGSRSAEPPFDWQKPETWASALEGVSAAYVSYYPDVAIPGARKRYARSPNWRHETAFA